ncbi:alpha/beta fold hydrolase [Melghirimyces algeriensis]|uniref:Alpha/beta hydrolase family protein n=1 Tax=Melghirimyces algeriensis TaxID=910412 RepID=A0A521D9B5_9BACL|nr:alpha/beta fold hydrolase [Melghirimyces algeriensis]SMO68306.1 Alpha/beta hydrolase family protein [Melghirimyces algeriensis]
MATIFLTGATGFIGKELLKRLGEEGHTILALIRSKDKYHKLKEEQGFHEQQVIPILGDLSKENLGIERRDMKHLVKTEIMIHAGGPMDIELDEEVAKRVFLGATKELFKLCRKIQHQTHPKAIQHFIHLVGYKSPFHEGNIPWDRDVDQMTDFLPDEGAYERMKLLSDILVRQQARELAIPLSVVNPSTVIGNIKTGETVQVKGVGMLVDSVRSKKMLAVPGGASYWLPLITNSELATFICLLVNQPDPKSNTYYTMADRSDTPNLRELLTMIAHELRTIPPKGSIPIPVLKRLLRSKLGEKMGIPEESLGFLIQHDINMESVKNIHAEPFKVKPILHHVIADLDYQLSHGDTVPSHIKRNKRGELATLETVQKGTPVVFLHGLFSGADHWVPIMNRITAGPAIAVDLPGFGRSPYHHQKDSLQAMIDSVVQVVDEIGQPVILVGHSFGGWIASQVSQRVPNQIKQLILLQPGLQSSDKRKTIYKLPWLSSKLALKFSNEEQLRKAFVKSSAFENSATIPNDYVQYVLNDLASPRVRKTNAEILARFHRKEGLQPYQMELDPLKTTIILGTKDTGFSIEPYNRKYQTIPVSYHHSFPISHPDETAELIHDVILGKANNASDR